MPEDRRVRTKSRRYQALHRQGLTLPRTTAKEAMRRRRSSRNRRAWPPRSETRGSLVTSRGLLQVLSSTWPIPSGSKWTRPSESVRITPTRTPNLMERRTAEAKALLNGAAVTEYMNNQSEIIKAQSDYMMLAEPAETDKVNTLL